MQADSCLNSEQIDTLLISVRGQEMGFGGKGVFGPEAQNLHVTAGGAKKQILDVMSSYF